MKLNRGQLTDIILSTIATAGIISVALVAPGAMKIVAKVVTHKRRHTFSYINRRTQQLISQGFVRKHPKTNKLELTSRGALRLAQYKNKKKSSRRSIWDGKWRIIMFDVWEKNRLRRDQLRTQIKLFGFVQLQRSVWIYPYECQEFAILIKTSFRFGNNFRFIVADDIGDDRAFRAMFNVN